MIIRLRNIQFSSNYNYLKCSAGAFLMDHKADMNATMYLCSFQIKTIRFHNWEATILLSINWNKRARNGAVFCDANLIWVI